MLSEGLNKIISRKKIIWVSATKSWEELRNFRYGLSEDILSKGQKTVGEFTSGSEIYIFPLFRYLHQKDPHEWTIERLTESFPVDRFGVKKILKNSGPKSLQSLHRLDKQVDLELFNRQEGF